MPIQNTILEKGKELYKSYNIIICSLANRTLAMLLSLVIVIAGFPMQSLAATTEDSGTDKLLNGSFESFNDARFPSDKKYIQVPSEEKDYWKTTADTKKIELLKENTGVYIDGNAISIADGNIAAELNADEESSLYQVVNTEPSSLYEWGLYHAARTRRETMALIIGPNQEVAPSKSWGEGFDSSDASSSNPTIKTGYKYGKDQMMQMVSWLKSTGRVGDITTQGIANGNKPIVLYSKKFDEHGQFKDNADKQPFSMKASSIYTEKWYIWIITDTNEAPTSNTLSWSGWSGYGIHDPSVNTESSSLLNNYYHYSVPSGQNKTLFAFTSVENETPPKKLRPDPTYGNFLDGITFRLHRVLSGSSTEHGSAIIASSDGTTSGEGAESGHMVTADNGLSTYVKDGSTLTIKGKVNAADKSTVSFVGVYYTVQNPDGGGNKSVFYPSTAEGWTIEEDDKGNLIYSRDIENITSATDLHFVFVKSPRVTYDPNGGKPYDCMQESNDPTDPDNVYNFAPGSDGSGGLIYVYPYTSHPAEGQNDAWMFMGWKLFDASGEVPGLVSGIHSVAYNQASAGESQESKFVVIGEGDTFNEPVETDDGITWDSNGTKIYEDSSAGLSFVAQWRWRQTFVPMTSDGTAFTNSDEGGTVAVTSAADASGDIYDTAYDENGAKAYYAETNETVTAKATAKDGYFFDGWYDDKGNQITTSDTITYVETKEGINTYYAHFIKEYEQRFIRQIKIDGVWTDLADDDASLVKLLDHTTAHEVPGQPVSSTAANNSTYSLIGWYDGPGEDALPVDESMLLNDGKTLRYTVEGNSTYYARFASSKTVNFKKQYIEADGTITDLANSHSTYGTLSTYSESGVAGDVLRSKAYPIIGYELVGWYDGPGEDANRVDFLDPSDSKIITPEILEDDPSVKTYYARFRARSDIAYVVRHYFKDWDNTGSSTYKMLEAYTYYGTTGEMVTPSITSLTGNKEGYRYEKGIETKAITGDGRTVFNIYYIKTPTVLTYEPNPPDGVEASEVEGNVSEQSGYVSYDVSVGPLTEDEGFSIPGYIFNGWNTEPDGSGTSYSKDDAYTLLADKTDEAGNSVNPNVLYAQWVPDTAVSYTVEHYKLSLDGTSAVLALTENFAGTTGESVTASPKSFTGYTYEDGYSSGELVEIKQGEIEGDGSLILKLYYSPQRDTLTYKANGGIGADVVREGVTGEDMTVENGADMFTRPGYTFTGWKTQIKTSDKESYAVDDSYTLTNLDDILLAQWKANTDTPYKVYHYIVSPDGTGCQLVSVGTDGITSNPEIKKGTTGKTVNAKAINVPGYTYKSDFDSNGMKTVNSGVVTGDGNLSLKLYYIPNPALLTYDPNGAPGNTLDVPGVRGDTTSILGSIYSRPGYVFTGWNTEKNGGGTAYEQNDVYTYNADSYTLYAQWEPRSDVKYTVEHYLVKADGSSAVLKDTETFSNGTTDAEVSATPKSYAGYTYQPTYNNDNMQTVSTGTVTADGNLVLKLYYTPNNTRLIYKPNGGTGTDQVQEGLVNEVVTVKEGDIFTYDGYIFVGWNTEADGSGTDYAPGSDYTLLPDDSFLYAQWDARREVGVSVKKKFDFNLPGYPIEFKITYSDNADFSDPAVITKTYTVISDEAEADIWSDLPILEGSYVKVEEIEGEYTPKNTSTIKITESDGSSTERSYTLGDSFRIERNKKYLVTLDNTAQLAEDMHFQKVWIDRKGNVVDYNKTESDELSSTKGFEDIQCLFEKSSDGGLTWEPVQTKYPASGTPESLTDTDRTIPKAAEAMFSDITDAGSKLHWSKSYLSSEWHLPLKDENGNTLMYRMTERESSLPTGWKMYDGTVTYTESGAEFVNPVTGSVEKLDYFEYDENHKVKKQAYQSNFFIINYDARESISLEVNKIDGTNSTELNEMPLYGAEFTLYVSNPDGAEEITYKENNTPQIVKCSEVGRSVTARTSGGDAAIAEFADMLLYGNEYYLVETKAPAGYRLDSEPRKITFKDKTTFYIDGIEKDSADGVLALKLANYLTVDMPVAGLNLTGKSFMTIGLLALFIALALIVLSSRRKI